VLTGTQAPALVLVPTVQTKQLLEPTQLWPREIASGNDCTTRAHLQTPIYDSAILGAHKHKVRVRGHEAADRMLINDERVAKGELPEGDALQV